MTLQLPPHSALASIHTMNRPPRPHILVLVLAILLAAANPFLAQAQSADAWVASGRLKLQAHNLPGAHQDFQNAVAASPNDPTANVFLAVTRLAVMEQQPQAKAWLARWGFPLVGRDLYHWTSHPPKDAEGVPVVIPGAQASEFSHLVRTNLVPEFAAAISQLERVTASTFLLSLNALETGTQAVQVDRADIVLIRAGLHWLEYLGSTLDSWNLDIDLSVVRDLARGGNLTAERLLARFPKAFTFATTNDLAFARTALTQFIDRYQEASELIRNRPSGLTRLFNWDPPMAADEAEFRQVLSNIRAALQGPFLWSPDRAIAVDARNLFSGQSSPRDWLPMFDGDAIVAGTLPDPTLGGLVSGMSSSGVEDYFNSSHRVLGEQIPAFHVVPRIEAPQFADDGSVQFVAYGPEKKMLLLQVSTNLVDWTIRASGWVLDGVAALRDVEAGGSDHRFYRAMDASEMFVISGAALENTGLVPMVNARVRVEVDGLVHISVEGVTGSDGRYLLAFDSSLLPLASPATITIIPKGWEPQRWDLHVSGTDHLEIPFIFVDEPFPPNDAFSGRIALQGDQASVTVANYSCSTEFGEPSHDALGKGPTAGISRWWSYTPTQDGFVRINSVGLQSWATIAIYTGDSPAHLSRVTADQKGIGQVEVSLRFRAKAGVEYQIAVDALRFDPLLPFTFELRFTSAADAKPYRIDTVAGDLFPTAKDGAGATARFFGPQGMARNSKGRVWIADSSNHLIREVGPDGTVTTVAGLPGNSGATDGKGTLARFDTPSDVVFDIAGNAYVSDFGNHTIRRITPDGTVTTVAGKAGAAGWKDGAGVDARFHNPSGLTITRDGTLYVTESWNHTVRRISTVGQVATIAGAAEEPGFLDEAGLDARFDMPVDIEADSFGNLYVADLNNQLIRRIATNGQVTTIAGQPHLQGSLDGPVGTALLDRPSALFWTAPGLLTFVQGDHTVRQLSSQGVVITLAGLANVAGSADGSAAKARFNFPSGVTSDGLGGWWIDDSGNNAVRRLSSSGQVTTVAGQSVTNATDGVAGVAQFNGPSGVALEKSGSMVVGDWNNHTLRRVLPSGEVITLAGSPGNRGSDDGQGSEARFNAPADVALNPDGTLVVAEWENHQLRKVTPDGKVTSLAGDPEVSGWEDGTGRAGRFVYPSGICVDGLGFVYVADAGAHLIRRVTPLGAVTTIAGTGGVPGSDDGNGLSASFNTPSDVAIDANGNLFVADSGNHVIRKITSNGTVSTFAGAMGEAGVEDGQRLQARFDFPALLAFGPGNALYVVESSHTLRRIDANGLVQTLAGSSGEAGYFDAAGTAARFNFPSGLAVRPDGTVVLTDYGNNVIREVPVVGETRTVSGVALPNAADGIGSGARFDGPAGLAVDGSGTVYVADWNNSALRRIRPNGEVTTLAGSAGHPGISDGLGRAAQFIQPADVVLDSRGNAFVVDAGAHTIRRVTPQGEVSTFAGKGGESGTAGGLGVNARFNAPGGIGIGPGDVLYVADSGNHIIRKIEPSGLVSTLAGSPMEPGYRDADGPFSQFNSPADVAVDGSGNLYVADLGNNSLRRISPQGEVSTVAGYRTRPGSADGFGREIRLSSPISLALTPTGDLIIADYLNQTLRRFTVTGESFTIAGSPGLPSSADGVGAAARFKAPGGIAVDSTGQVYISDFTGNVIRRGRVVSGN